MKIENAESKIDVADLANASSQARSVYVHVPFCAQRCGYCNFALVANRDYMIDEFIDAISLEIKQLVGDGRIRDIDTLFLGGGTPTHLSPKQLGQLVDTLFQSFRLADQAEFTIEANPNDITPEKIESLASTGVTRISLGAQSFRTDKLLQLERNHRSEDIHRAVKLAREFAQSVSLDLIFGTEDETLEQWSDDLRSAIRLGVDHVSTYHLTIEKGTTFFNRHAKNRLKVVDHELSAIMYEKAIDTLGTNGFCQYEISNFARDGHECRHNNSYWDALPYLSFGPGAASFGHNKRWINHCSVSTYLKRLSEDRSPVSEIEQLDDELLARERLIFGMRRNRGVLMDQFERQTGYSVRQLVSPNKIEMLVSQGLIDLRKCDVTPAPSTMATTISKNPESKIEQTTDSDNVDTDVRISLTRSGLMVSDSIWVEFL